MREIKFRVHDTENQRMSNPFSLDYLVVVFADMDVIPVPFAVRDRERFNVMQYTGIKDKNGKEIFEGDVVKHNGTNSTAKDNPCLVVEFRHGAFCLTASKEISGSDRSITIRDLMFAAKNVGMQLELEVIGNIYENPELLELNK